MSCIRRIEIKKLFGYLNYSIEYNNNVSIFIAPNGCGKTTIFKFIDFISNPTAEGLLEIAQIPFSEFKCTFDNTTFNDVMPEELASQLVFKKVDVERGNFSGKTPNERARKIIKAAICKEICGEYKNMYISYNVARGGKFIVLDDSCSCSLTNQFMGRAFSTDAVNYVNRRLIERNNTSNIVNDNNYEIVDIDYKRIFPNNSFNDSWIHCFLDAKRIIEKADYIGKVNYIRANRLYDDNTSNSSPKANSEIYSHLRDKINRDNYEISNQSIEKLNISVASDLLKSIRMYHFLIARAERELPVRYMHYHRKSDFNEETEVELCKRRWRDYYDELQKYNEIGFVSSNSDYAINYADFEKNFDEKGDFLKVYIDVYESTLKPFRGVYEKYKLLADIFNERNKITHKKIAFTDDGVKIRVLDKDGTINEFGIDKLSSGEQNDLLMFYDLIFNSDYISTVLIDEPEISLHIEWQESYIDLLMKICEMKNMQAIVATHSPHIINGHFDLYAKRDMEDEL